MSDASRRPQTVVARDESVFQVLTEGPKTLVDLTARLSLEQGQAYGSVWRGRKAGLVEKARVGGRTPVWQLTEAGVSHVSAKAAEPVAAPEPVAQPVVG